MHMIQEIMKSIKYWKTKCVSDSLDCSRRSRWSTAKGQSMQCLQYVSKLRWHIIKLDCPFGPRLESGGSQNVGLTLLIPMGFPIKPDSVKSG